MTATTLTLTDFLLARIAENEAVARDAALLGADCIAYDDGGRPGGLCNVGDYDPARVLAECEAKRRIVEIHVPVDYTALGMTSPNACHICGIDAGMGEWEWEENSFPCPTLRALGAVYADHADYRDEWRP